MPAKDVGRLPRMPHFTRSLIDILHCIAPLSQKQATNQPRTSQHEVFSGNF